MTSDDFVKKISEGLVGRQWLVLVMTPAALTSPWVQREVNVALNEQAAGRMLGVVPIVMQPCPEQDIPMLWRTLHRYDATQNYSSAIAGLLVATGLHHSKSPAPAPTTPVPQRARPDAAASSAPPSPNRAIRKQIYVSYADEDHVFVAKLVKSLNDRIRPGSEMAWHNSARQARAKAGLPTKMAESLAASRLLYRAIFVVVLSPDAVKAPYVNEEIKQARLADKEFVPVLLRDCQPDADLAAIPPVSFLPPRDYDEALDELMDMLRAAQ